MTEHDAFKKLQEIIVKETPVRPDGQITLEWFVLNRYVPLKQPRWRNSTRRKVLSLLQNQIIKHIGTMPVSGIDRFTLQSLINQLKEMEYSTSILKNTVSLIKDVWLEMQDQEYIDKNCAARLTIPKIDEPVDSENGISKPFLDLVAMKKLLQAMPNAGKPHRLICALSGVMGLSPGELFALFWGDITEAGLKIYKGVHRGFVGLTKTRARVATLPLPTLIRQEFKRYKSSCHQTADTQYVFATSTGKPFWSDNYVWRTLAPIGATVTEIPVTFQLLRRSAATNIFNFPECGSKELQFILRHKTAENFSTEVYQQALRSRVFAVLERYANESMTGLEDRSEVVIPVESIEHTKEHVTQVTTA